LASAIDLRTPEPYTGQATVSLTNSTHALHVLLIDIVGVLAIQRQNNRVIWRTVLILTICCSRLTSESSGLCSIEFES
jgi:hypothetical protein